MNETQVHDFRDPLNLVSGVVMILNGVVGIVLNISIIYIYWQAPAERTAFNLICVCRAVCNVLILAWAFLATFVPITFLGTSPFTPYYETLVIGLANTIYTVIQNTGMLIAFNRLCAVFFPLYYQKAFTIKYTFLLGVVLFLWKIVSITQEFMYYLPLECYMTFSSDELAWMPTFEDRCAEDNDYTINKTAVFLGVMVIANLVTFIKIYLFYKSTHLVQQRKEGKMRKNKVMFMQTLVQDTVMLLDMLFTFRLNELSTARYWSFISGSLIWETVHSLDGFIMIMFNERLTFLKHSFFSSTANNSRVFVSTSPASHLKGASSMRSQTTAF